MDKDGEKETEKLKITGQLKRYNSSFILLFYHVSKEMLSVPKCMTKKNRIKCNKCCNVSLQTQHCKCNMTFCIWNIERKPLTLRKVVKICWGWTYPLISALKPSVECLIWTKSFPPSSGFSSKNTPETANKTGPQSFQKKPRGKQHPQLSSNGTVEQKKNNTKVCVFYIFFF